MIRALAAAALSVAALTACAPASAPAPSAHVLRTTVHAADAPLIVCEEDEACWAGSANDSRPWAEQRTAALADGWVSVGADCVAYWFPADSVGTTEQTLMRCADGTESLSGPEVTR